MGASQDQIDAGQSGAIAQARANKDAADAAKAPTTPSHEKSVRGGQHCLATMRLFRNELALFLS